ncbi:MAG TPA: hypothetical protein P5096_01320 [Patescibacteria group bacterium]|nr:hypothetical protein [Patescibacteria group bacterium]
MATTNKNNINKKTKRHSKSVAYFNSKEKTKTLTIPPKGKRTRQIVLTARYTMPNETDAREIDEALARYFMRFLPEVYQDDKLESGGITLDSKKNKTNKKSLKNKKE